MVAATGLIKPTASTALGKRFDLVGFDPRGIGASELPVHCLSDAERDADRADDSETDGSPQGVIRQEAQEKDFGIKCVQRTEHGPEMLANLGTREVVKDMDVLRSVLGDRKLTIDGDLSDWPLAQFKKVAEQPVFPAGQNADSTTADEGNPERIPHRISGFSARGPGARP